MTRPVSPWWWWAGFLVLWAWLAMLLTLAL
jgi:hypothetical protein